MKKINIGLIGLGTIGRGVYDAVIDNGALISKRTGVSLAVRTICDKNKKALTGLKGGAKVIKTGSFEEVINDKKIDVVVELVGGIHPAKEIILGAIRNKKHVVTANKALLSEHWKGIFSAASRNNVIVNFEGAVGGAIPVIRALRESYVANRINTIYGILNGTTNFILTDMSERSLEFAHALRLAQERGIAEKDPTLDISGKDSAHKLAILALLGFGIDVSPRDIYTEGITALSPQDISYAKRWGYSVKLLGIAKVDARGVDLRVHPTLLRASHLLSDVRDADNAVFIKGDLAGESLLFGKGAGRKPTASSVVADLVDIGKHVVFGGGGNPSPYNFNYAYRATKLTKIEGLSIPYYLRFSVIDRPGVLASIASILSKYDISIATVSQEERKKGAIVPVVILTHKAKEGNMRRAIGRINKMGYVKAKTVVIRIEE